MEAVALQALVTILKIQHSPPTASVSLMSQLELEMYFAGINEKNLKRHLLQLKMQLFFKYGFTSDQYWLL